MSFTFFLTVLSFLTASYGQILEYQNRMVLDDEGQYFLRWTVTDTDIFFETTVNTTGYVGFGISKAGRMNPADMVIGWIANGQMYFGDYFTTTDSRAPQMDPSQDWLIQEGVESNGTTVLRFQRKLDTCDINDEKITRDTMHIIYSYHSQDPDTISGLVPYHGQSKRGTRTTILMGRDITPDTFPPNNTFMVEIKNYMFTIPPSGSRRQCIVHNIQLPRSHMIKV